MNDLIIGIDYSFTCPSICILGEDFKSSKFYFLIAKQKFSKTFSNNLHGFFMEPQLDYIRKYEYISSWALNIIKRNLDENSKLRIAVEGYAFGAKSSMVFNIAENCGILKYRLKHELNVTCDIIAPSSAKKFFSGKGNANKEIMINSLKDQEGINLLEIFGTKTFTLSPLHDIVDSYAIAKKLKSTL